MFSLSGFWTIVKLIPELIVAIKAIMKLVEAGEHHISVTIDLNKIDKAMEKAKNDKDTSQLEDIFNPKPAPPGALPK